ncbi:MAG TPA: hypothetical protein PKD37_07340 [Oligoflexia bacterium]|nr:hypothetical protein [Oligoflexia bacterium]HMP27776.1 hypothetical protein [Oligoflexia bacterium]
MFSVAIDGAALPFSVAVADGGVIREQVFQNSDELAERVVSLVDSFDWSKVSRLIIGVGPGSFTGLRAARAFALGVVAAATGGGVQLFGACSHLARAMAVKDGLLAEDELLVIDSAGREGFFVSCYRFVGGGEEWRRVVILRPPEIVSVEKIASLSFSKVVLAGDLKLASGGGSAGWLDEYRHLLIGSDGLLSPAAGILRVAEFQPEFLGSGEINYLRSVSARPRSK